MTTAANDPAQPEKAKLIRLEVSTYHPEDYVLVNERDGTRWRGTHDGRWKRQEACNWQDVDHQLLAILARVCVYPDMMGTTGQRNDLVINQLRQLLQHVGAPR